MGVAEAKSVSDCNLNLGNRDSLNLTSEALGGELKAKESKKSESVGSWLMCSPAHFDVTYEINPWMSTQNTPNSSYAMEQWANLYHTMVTSGAEVELISQISGFPDMVFTANGGLVKGTKAVIPNFRHQERKGEEPYFEKWFISKGFETLKTQATFEGAGDGLYMGDTLVFGFGQRSDSKAANEVADFLGAKDIIVCKLIDPRFYHLDTCFCPLDDNTCLVYPKAFDEESLGKLSESFKLIRVEESDALAFACNSVVLGDTVIHPSCSSALDLELASIGKKGIGVELSEFLKAGGAAKCLCLQLS